MQVYRRKTYAKDKRTLFGEHYRTDLIYDAGTNIRFGAPWAPNEGVLSIPASAEEMFAIRVMAGRTFMKVRMHQLCHHLMFLLIFLLSRMLYWEKHV